MPLYNLDDFKKILREHGYDLLNPSRASDNLDKLNWDEDYFLNFLLNLDSKDFQKTVPNCKINNCPVAPKILLVDADQYEVYWDEENNCRSATRYTAALSLKIAILADDNGNYAGVVTFHMSGSLG